MSKEKPPYGTVSRLFAGPRESARQERANKEYWKGVYRGKGMRDGSRS